MGQYYVMTKNGLTPPKYVHEGIASAQQEAWRLHTSTNDKVLILEIVGVIKEVEVPVTKMEAQLIMKADHEDFDLPF